MAIEFSLGRTLEITQNTFEVIEAFVNFLHVNFQICLPGCLEVTELTLDWVECQLVLVPHCIDVYSKLHCGFTVSIGGGIFGDFSHLSPFLLILLMSIYVGFQSL